MGIFTLSWEDMDVKNNSMVKFKFLEKVRLKNPLFLSYISQHYLAIASKVKKNIIKAKSHKLVVLYILTRARIV